MAGTYNIGPAVTHDESEAVPYGCSVPLCQDMDDHVVSHLLAPTCFVAHFGAESERQITDSALGNLRSFAGWAAQVVHRTDAHRLWFAGHCLCDCVVVQHLGRWAGGAWPLANRCVVGSGA